MLKKFWVPEMITGNEVFLPSLPNLFFGFLNQKGLTLFFLSDASNPSFNPKPDVFFFRFGLTLQADNFLSNRSMLLF